MCVFVHFLYRLYCLGPVISVSKPCKGLLPAYLPLVPCSCQLEWVKGPQPGIICSMTHLQKLWRKQAGLLECASTIARALTFAVHLRMLGSPTSVPIGIIRFLDSFCRPTVFSELAFSGILVQLHVAYNICYPWVPLSSNNGMVLVQAFNHWWKTGNINPRVGSL